MVVTRLLAWLEARADKRIKSIVDGWEAQRDD